MPEKTKKPVVLTIGGFDPGSGAGISADLKTFGDIGVYGVSVITCLTSQNHTEFRGVEETDPAFLTGQIGILSEGYRIQAAKTGLLTKRSMEIVREWKKANPACPLISDPVFAATSGRVFFGNEDVKFFKEGLLRYADLITPNIEEAEFLSGIKIKNILDMKEAGRTLQKEFSARVLIKGGHLDGDAVDILFAGSAEQVYGHERISGVNTHGSGCILSAAITAYVAMGEEFNNAITLAKAYLTGLMSSPANLEGIGPVIEPGCS